MPAEFRRKLYTRGCSHETTIPMPMLFSFDLENEKHDVVFKFDPKTKRWYVEVERRDAGAQGNRDAHRSKKPIRAASEGNR